MNKTLQMTALGLLLVGLVGCDAAEQSAQKLAEKAEQAVQDVAREAVDETLQQLNKQEEVYFQIHSVVLVPHPNRNSSNNKSSRAKCPSRTDGGGSSRRTSTR